MQAVIAIGDLPSPVLEAASAFHTRYVAQARAALAGEADSLVLVFPSAAYDHAGWRKAVIADLARSGSPKRVNGLSGGDDAAIAAGLAWLAQASGVTGQLLPLAEERDASNFTD